MSAAPPADLTSDYDYELPDDLVAHRPAAVRDDSRLLVCAPDGNLDRRFSDLVAFLEPGDALVLNDTRVFPARLVGRRSSGSAAEILLLRPLESDDVWEALVRPGSKLKPGRVVEISSDLRVEIEAALPGGARRVRLAGNAPAWELIRRHGRVPLPPYIEREADASDRERYQTVYAEPTGSVAAPTAGLHFTRGLLDDIAAADVRIATLTLHVGVGTFRPVSATRVSEHELHAERYVFSASAADSLNAVRAAGGRIWAVGTTVVRTLETVVDDRGSFAPSSGSTDLFIHPPHRFRGVDGLVTNFHLPRSSLLMLVAAFAGRERVLAAYAHAIREGYRFYSYGDAMAVLPAAAIRG